MKNLDSSAITSIGFVATDAPTGEQVSICWHASAAGEPGEMTISGVTWERAQEIAGAIEGKKRRQRRSAQATPQTKNKVAAEVPQKKAQAAEVAQTPAPSSEQPTAKPVPIADPAPADGGAQDVPEELRTAKRLKEAVGWFIDQGMTDADTIAAKCAEVRDKVPVLSRATNLADRVARIVAATVE